MTHVLDYYSFSRREILGSIHYIKVISSQIVIFTLDVSSVIFMVWKKQTLMMSRSEVNSELKIWWKSMLKNQNMNYERKT